MGLFSRKPAPLSTAGLVVDRCWHDPALDAAIDTVAAGDLTAGRHTLAESRGDTEQRAQRLQGLGEVSARFRPQIQEWSTAEPHDADLALWLGRALTSEAWEIRGGGWARTVGHDRFASFHETLALANAALLRAIEIAPDDPVALHEMQWVAMGLQAAPQQELELWSEIAALSPTLFPAHWAHLSFVSQKWNGSHDEMFAAARRAVQVAPVGHPLTAMLPLAHAEYMLYEVAHPSHAGRQEPPTFQQDYHRDPTRLAEVVAAEAKWLTDRRPHPRDLEAHQLFAGYFLTAGDLDRARWHLAQVGDRVATVPWAYRDTDKTVAFARALRVLGLPIPPHPR